jgi:outer membrane protein assembly factor BamD (BamD/ComL family)
MSVFKNRHTKRLLAAAVAGLMMGPVGPSSSARAQDDFSFDIVEDKVTDNDKQRIEDAKDLVAQERFAEALSAFEGILADAKLKKFHEGVQYDMCKALYKMEAYHGSLACFEKILVVGPKHSMYTQSREWLFFIARKVKDELAPLKLIARYAKAEDIPAEYQSELGYALGRYYFLTALELGAKGVAVEVKKDEPAAETKDEGALDFGIEDTEKKEEPKEEEKKDEGGFDFSSDDVGGGDGDWGPRDPRRSEGLADELLGNRPLLAQDGGIDFDFGDAKSKNKGKPKKPKGKKKDDKKDDKKDEKKDDKKEETKAEEAKAPEPVVEKHAFEGPKTADEALRLALANLDRVKPDFSLYAQAVYIKGLVHFAQGQFDPAVKSFREVVRMTNPRGGTVKNEKLREMAFFSLARIHYEFEQFRYAIFYYDRISRDSEQWLEAIFESSWAHFRLAEYEKALGNLVTLQSPFFQDQYYPEAAILKAITFYENCRYPEARAFLGEFEQNYGGVLEELKRLIGENDGKVADASGGTPPAASAPKSPTELFDELTALEAKVAEGRDDGNRSFALTARLLRLALSDKRVRGYRDAIDEVDAENQLLQNLEAPFAGGTTHQEILKAVADRRAELVRLAGTLLRDKLIAERQFLTDLNSKLVRIQFEITKGEKETLEAKISGQTQQTNTTDYTNVTAVDDERLYWPFEGEYWRDELGTYQYTLTRGCRPPSDTTITGN